MTSLRTSPGDQPASGSSAGSRTLSPGFSLVEVALALGLVAFVLVSLIALIPLGLNSSKQSLEESRALNILSALRSDRLTTPFSLPSGVYGLPALTNAAGTSMEGFLGIDDQGRSTGQNLQQARYRIDYRIVFPSAGQRGPFFANLRAGWPAAAPRPEGSVEIAATFPQP